LDKPGGKMLIELQKYYEANKISAINFDCPHYKCCSIDCARFSKAKEAFVSTGYENHVLPRLLFISLDSGEGDPKDKRRTLAFIREQEENNFEISSLKSEQNKHWYRTHELAHWFLRKYKFNLHDDQVHHYFAHTNSAKCCMNLGDKKQADKRLFMNCREFIPGEVIILDPDIIVTQGAEAEQAILGCFDQLPLTDYVTIDQSLPEVRVISIKGAPVIWFHTFHPSSWGDFNSQRRDRFHIYTNIAFNFIKKTKRWTGIIT
jgi:hypothetical protein